MMAQLGTPRHALECKAHWAARLLDGSKTVEVRGYALPEELLGVPIALVATEGPEGRATLGDVVVAGKRDGHVVCAYMRDTSATRLCKVGHVVFAAIKRYESAESFASDQARHGVAPGSVYGWQPGTTELFGWCVGSRTPCAPTPLPAMRRMVRSLYVLEAASAH